MKKLIFIQGIHDFPLKNKKLFTFLEKQGFEVQYFPTLYTVLDTEKQKELISKINDYIISSSEKISILAHSFGGIIAYSLEDNVYKNIDTIVTVGSPHTFRPKWFLSVISKIGYKKHTVRNQASFGMRYDFVVKNSYTRYSFDTEHHMLSGFHESLLRNRKIMTKVVDLFTYK